MIRRIQLLMYATGLALASLPGVLRAEATATRPQAAVGASRGFAVEPAKPEPMQPVGRRFALCIGIDHYLAGSGYQRLSCACNDARTLGQVFASLGYRVTVMTDDAGSALAPTADNLEREIREFARKADNPDDEVVLSYSGHGDIVDDQAALVPLDYDAERHPNLVTVSDVLERLNDRKCRAQNKLLLLDACHAAKQNTERFLTSFAHERSLVVISACDSGQNSYEDATLHHGRFTQVLIWGLVGAGFTPPATRPADPDSELQWHGEAYPAGAEFLSATQLSEYIGGVFRKNNWAAAGGRGQSTAQPNAAGQNPRMFGNVDVTAPMIVARQKVVQPPPLTDEDRQSMQEILQKAETAYLAGQFVPMMHHSTTALRIQDNNADALALRALGNLRAAYTGAAEADARAATKLDPRQAIAWQVLGMCQAGKRSDAAAMESLLTANRLIERDMDRWHLIAGGEEAARRFLKIGDLSSDAKDKFTYYLQAARTPNSSKDTFGEAANWVGYLYDTGHGVQQDYDRAMSWYRKAADAGNSGGMNNIAYLFACGHGVGQDYAQALDWFRKAADAGNSKAMGNIGYLCMFGHGFVQDDIQAMSWYRKALAADAGNATVMSNIGYLYDQGRGVGQDYARAMTWYRKALAADAGNSAAMYNIGSLYKLGHGVGQDYAQAMTWYRKAADSGNTDAMNNIGYLYMVGHGVGQDYAQAMTWYHKAADSRNVGAMNNVGYLYDQGQGVEQDYRQAMTWYRKAADAGTARSMYHIAVLYENGRGVAKSEEQARFWYAKAAEGGDEDSKKWLAAHVGRAAATTGRSS